MNIKSARYEKDIQENNSSITAIINGEEYSVPLDPDNRHYQEIQEWVKIDGNTIAEAD
jgi:hypothetical protein